MPVWYYSQNAQPVGPLDEPQIVALVGQGKIKPTDLVWREDMPQWASAAEAGLLHLAAKQRAQAPVANDPANYFTQMIEDSRSAFGPPPRDLVISPYLQLTPPAWMQKFPRDLLWEIYRRQEVLWRHGTLVWGCSVQANQQLFSPGPNDCPASLIYSPHLWFDGRLNRLVQIANSLFSIKGKQQSDPEMMEFSRVLADEKDRAPRLRVPQSLSGEYPVFHTSVMVVRKHLPHGHLTNRIFPVLIEPQSTTAVIILPCCYWPPALLAEWNGDVAGAAERTTSSGRAPATPRGPAPNMEKQADGQYKDYWVVSPAERAKGFVRPVLMQYRHDRCGAITAMALDIAETFARNPKFYGGTFCSTCRNHFPTPEFTWVGPSGQITDQRVGS